MYIRNYDGDILINCDHVESYHCKLDEFDDDYYQVSAYFNHGSCTLQGGMTKDAAMELLTQIQNAISNGIPCLNLMPNFEH